MDPQPARPHALANINAVLVKKSEVASIKRTETQQCNVINVVMESLFVLSMFVLFVVKTAQSQPTLICCKYHALGKLDNVSEPIRRTKKDREKRGRVTDKMTGRAKQQQPR